MPNRAFPYEPKHRDGFNRVRSRVYRGGDPVRDDENLLPADCSGTLVERNGEVVGAATSIHYNCTFGSSSLKSAGVAAVGVLPEARRCGAGKELMFGVNRQMRDEGFAMALLYPYSASFYRQFGYEYAGNRLTISCPSGSMPRIGDALAVREIKFEDSASLEECYKAFASRFPGMNHRNELQWARALGGEKPFSIFACGDPIEAFALVRLEWTFWVDQVVREFVWSTPLGYRSMLSFFKGLAANKNAISWFEPSSSPWMAQFGERDVTLNANQQIMWRVLDVPRALETLRCDEPVVFCIGIDDPEFIENRGPWRVNAGPTRSTVEKVEIQELSMHVGNLAQALVGEPSFSALAEMGLVSSNSVEVTRIAGRAFGSSSGYCLEFF